MISTSGACQNTPSWFFFLKTQIVSYPCEFTIQTVIFQDYTIAQSTTTCTSKCQMFHSVKKTHTLHISLHVHEYGMQ